MGLRSRRPPTTDRLKQDYNRMIGKLTVPEDELSPPIDFMLHHSPRNWIRMELNLNTAAHNVMDNYNVSIIQASFALLAQRHGFTPFLIGPQPGRTPRYELPPLPNFRPAANDVTVRGMRPSAEGWSCLDWARRDAGVIPEQLIDSGIRILGALATMPEGSGIAVRDSANILYGITPGIRVAGCDPFPAGLVLQPIPPA